MEKIVKCQCKKCGVNVEFDAGELAPGEVRKGACPSCGMDMTFCDNSVGNALGVAPDQLGIRAESFNQRQFANEFSKKNKKIRRANLQILNSNKPGKGTGFVYRNNLFWSIFLPPLFVGVCAIIGRQIASDTENNYSGDPTGATIMVMIAGGIFAIIPWGICVWNTFERICSSCGRFDALRDIGSSEHVETRDTTQKEIRAAFVQHQLGKPEEMITYLQEVKVKQHTKKTRNRCICCGQDDYIYSCYTTKS